jgi:hypothetical protein
MPEKIATFKKSEKKRKKYSRNDFDGKKGIFSENEIDLFDNAIESMKIYCAENYCNGRIILESDDGYAQDRAIIRYVESQESLYFARFIYQKPKDIKDGIEIYGTEKAYTAMEQSLSTMADDEQFRIGGHKKESWVEATLKHAYEKVKSGEVTQEAFEKSCGDLDLTADAIRLGFITNN